MERSTHFLVRQTIYLPMGHGLTMTNCECHNQVGSMVDAPHRTVTGGEPCNQSWAGGHKHPLWMARIDPLFPYKMTKWLHLQGFYWQHRSIKYPKTTLLEWSKLHWSNIKYQIRWPSLGVDFVSLSCWTQRSGTRFPHQQTVEKLVFLTIHRVYLVCFSSMDISGSLVFGAHPLSSTFVELHISTIVL